MMLSKRRYAQSSSNERILFYEYLRYFRSRHGRPFQLSYRRSGTNRTDHPAAPWCRACTRGNFPFRFLCSYRHRTRHRPCADRRAARHAAGRHPHSGQLFICSRSRTYLYVPQNQPKGRTSKYRHPARFFCRRTDSGGTGGFSWRRPYSG